MTAIKKNSSNISKSPAPAKKTALAVKPAKPVDKKKVAPAVKPVATKPVVTTITAQIDIGFGNALYLRGDGPGLSWDKGVLMNCAADSRWQFIVGESARPIVFKFLVNDLSWSAGGDFSALPGSQVTLTPTF
jgi:hypothetical protein